jgi:hypothetical protein
MLSAPSGRQRNFAQKIINGGNKKKKISSMFRGKIKLKEFDKIGKDRVISFPNQK